MIGLAVVLALLDAIAALLKKGKAAKPTGDTSAEMMPFKRNKYFLSTVKQSFRGILKHAVAGQSTSSPRFGFWMSYGCRRRPRTGSGIGTWSSPSTWTLCSAIPMPCFPHWRLNSIIRPMPGTTESGGTRIPQAVWLVLRTILAGGAAQSSVIGSRKWPQDGRSPRPGSVSGQTLPSSCVGEITLENPHPRRPSLWQFCGKMSSKTVLEAVLGQLQFSA